MTDVTGRCDVIMANDGNIYVNGTLIERVMDVQVTRDANTPTRIIIEAQPSSIIFGDVPNETIQALSEDQADGAPSVDISRAIARARARKAGLDPAQHVVPAASSAAAYKPSAKKTATKKMYEDTDYEVAEG